MGTVMTDHQPDPTALDEEADTWELFAQGELSRDEQAFLRALAEDNEADALRMEAYAPLDASFRERMAERMAAQLAAEAGAPSLDAARRRRRYQRFATAAAVFAVAACALLVVRPNNTQVPEYALVIEGQIASERGAPPARGPLRVTPDSLLDIKLTPSVRASAELILSTFLERDGKVELWPVAAQRTSSGAFRIQGAARALLKAQFGECVAIFVIGSHAVDEPPHAGAEPSDLTVRRATLSYYPSVTDAP